MWKNIVESEEPPKGKYGAGTIHVGYQGYKHTLKEYVILTDFLLQQWLQERSSIFHYITFLMFIGPASL